MTVKDRIKLRDELFEKLKKLKIISLNKKDGYMIHGAKKITLYQLLNNNSEFKSLYNSYVNQFRSEEEALYCLIHNDDFENHKCIICGKQCLFYANRKHKKYRITCGSKTCTEKIANSESAKNKGKETIKIKYNCKHHRQNPEVIKKGVMTYHLNHDPVDVILDEEINRIINKIDFGAELFNIYSNDDYFKKFIQLMRESKNRLLQVNEMVRIFNRSWPTIKSKLIKLELLEYFDIQDSNLELKFKDFLIDNGFKESIDFERHNKSILPKSNNNDGSPELDFYLKDYNIAFEINDLGGHNVGRKDQYYHYNKTHQCLQKGIRLIHIWEWELTDSILWRRTSNWILNLLNSSKIELNLINCRIQDVSAEKQIDFFNQYNLYGYQQSDICLGLYCDNDLIQLMSFKKLINQEYQLLQFCTKFKYDMSNSVKELFNYFIHYYDPTNIIVNCSIDKFTGKTFEDAGFKLKEYIAPNFISNVKNCINIPENQKIYDCGGNVYVFER